MMDTFDKDYWETHWRQVDERQLERGLRPNPYLAREIGDLEPGAALDAGCGEGVEAMSLAAIGWQVTAADLSAVALGRARRRAGRDERTREIDWVEADLSVWEPDRRFDLVMTHYAHPAIGQLAFYGRIARWVAPGGTLLIVGHLHGHETGAAGSYSDASRHRSGPQGPPDAVQVSAASIVGLLEPEEWTVITADETSRTMRGRTGRVVELHDVVVRASRRA